MSSNIKEPLIPVPDLPISNDQICPCCFLSTNASTFKVKTSCLISLPGYSPFCFTVCIFSRIFESTSFICGQFFLYVNRSFLTSHRVKDGPWDSSAQRRHSWLFQTSFQFLDKILFTAAALVRRLHTPVATRLSYFTKQGQLCAFCNAITLIMSAHSPVAHYLKWFMGFIQANLPQCLLPLLVHECDACLSLTELMLLLLRVGVRSSFPASPSRWLNPGDFCVRTRTLLLPLMRDGSNAPFSMLMVDGFEPDAKTSKLKWRWEDFFLDLFLDCVLKWLKRR